MGSHSQPVYVPNKILILNCACIIKFMVWDQITIFYTWLVYMWLKIVQKSFNSRAKEILSYFDKNGYKFQKQFFKQFSPSCDWLHATYWGDITHHMLLDTRADQTIIIQHLTNQYHLNCITRKVSSVCLADSRTLLITYKALWWFWPQVFLASGIKDGQSTPTFCLHTLIIE